MPNTFFQFKQFTVHHDRCAMKVTTDACLFGAWVANEMKNDATVPATALDIGTGTGLLSLMVSQQNKISIDAIEIDKEAAQQAGENIAASPWKDVITIINGDVITWNSTKNYHCIFANPPFYENEIRSGKSTRNVAHHDDGLTLDKLFATLQKNLTVDGKFYLLLPAKRDKEIPALFQRYGFELNKKIVVRQSNKHLPFRLLIQGSYHRAGSFAADEIIIKDEADHYTAAFTTLLEDYYLYF